MALVYREKMKPNQLPLLSTLVLCISCNSLAVEAIVPTSNTTCMQLEKGEVVAHLDKKEINESSGLAVSQIYPTRLYHVNDSGDKGHLYITDLNDINSKNKDLKSKKVKIANWNAEDSESLAYGMCPNQTTKKCIYIGDIGDNLAKRDHIQIAVIEELEKFPKKVSPLKVITIKYSDRPHNAEGLAMHPQSGDLFLLTKEEDLKELKAFPTQLIRFRHEQVKNAGSEAITGELWGTLDTPSLTKDIIVWGQITTDLDIHPSGKYFIYSTYRKNIIVDFDLNSGKLPSTDVLNKAKKIKLFDQLDFPQIETINFAADGKSAYYTSEYHNIVGFVPLVQAKCLDQN